MFVNYESFQLIRAILSTGELNRWEGLKWVMSYKSCWCPCGLRTLWHSNTMMSYHVRMGYERIQSTITGCFKSLKKLYVALQGHEHQNSFICQSLTKSHPGSRSRCSVGNGIAKSQISFTNISLSSDIAQKVVFDHSSNIDHIQYSR